MNKTRYYKWTAGERPVCGWKGYDQTGAWQEVEGPIIPCRNGYHACTAEQVPGFCGTELWEVEIEGDIAALADQAVALRMRFIRKLRWQRADAVAYAQWCAADASMQGLGLTDPVARAAVSACQTEAVRAGAWAAQAVLGSSLSIVARAAADAAMHAAVARASANGEMASKDAAREARARQRQWIEERIGEKLG
jgi:hypothetical protein